MMINVRVHTHINTIKYIWLWPTTTINNNNKGLVIRITKILGMLILHNITARRCVLHGKFKWRLSIILQHAQTLAQGQCLEISQTTKPKP
jgi:uncharacterized membrane protein (UPF0127 family)